MNNTLTATELYQEILNVTDENERSHWCSDLYCKITPETKEILKHYKYKNQVKIFRDQITRTLWYDIPFAYKPYFGTVHGNRPTRADDGRPKQKEKR